MTNLEPILKNSKTLDLCISIKLAQVTAEQGRVQFLYYVGQEQYLNFRVQSIMRVDVAFHPQHGFQIHLPVRPVLPVELMASVAKFC